MPIVFTVSGCRSYYTAKYTGCITDESLLAEYRAWFRKGDWTPDMNELADLSDADIKGVTSEGIFDLVKVIEEISRKHGTVPKVAVYAPKDLPYGLAMIFSAQAERFETHRVFRDYAEAEAWIRRADQAPDR